MLTHLRANKRNVKAENKTISKLRTQISFFLANIKPFSKTKLKLRVHILVSVHIRIHTHSVHTHGKQNPNITTYTYVETGELL